MQSGGTKRKSPDTCLLKESGGGKKDLRMHPFFRHGHVDTTLEESRKQEKKIAALVNGKLRKGRGHGGGGTGTGIGRILTVAEQMVKDSVVKRMHEKFRKLSDEGKMFDDSDRYEHNPVNIEHANLILDGKVYVCVPFAASCMCGR